MKHPQLNLGFEKVKGKDLSGILKTKFGFVITDGVKQEIELDEFATYPAWLFDGSNFTTRPANS